jgi:hypothetical protein
LEGCRADALPQETASSLTPCDPPSRLVTLRPSGTSPPGCRGSARRVPGSHNRPRRPSGGPVPGGHGGGRPRRRDHRRRGQRAAAARQHRRRARARRSSVVDRRAGDSLASMAKSRIRSSWARTPACVRCGSIGASQIDRPSDARTDRDPAQRNRVPGRHVGASRVERRGVGDREMVEWHVHVSRPFWIHLD